MAIEIATDEVGEGGTAVGLPHLPFHDMGRVANTSPAGSGASRREPTTLT